MKRLKILILLFIASGKLYSANPVGFLDNASIDAIGGISGWALDTDAGQTSIAIAYYIYDGPTLVNFGTKYADKPRPDVNAAMGVQGNHGFSFSIPAIYLNKTIYISAGNIGLGNDVLLNNSQGTAIKLKSNLLYSTYTDPVSNRKLLTDLFRPITSPANKKLPLIVLVHGGGFAHGCKSYFETNGNSAQLMANVGYVVAAIDYRLLGRPNPAASCDNSLTSLNTTALCANNTFSNKAWYWAVQDLNAAIKFLVYNNIALNLNIDTNKIFIYGESAGAITVLTLAYASQQDIYNEMGGAAAFNAPYWGDLNATTNLNCRSISYKLSGVGAAYGAVAKSGFIGNNETVPVVMFHNPCDNLVTYESAVTNFKSGTSTIPQTDCFMYFYGSKHIADKFDSYSQMGYSVPYHHVYVQCDYYQPIATGEVSHKIKPENQVIFALDKFLDFTGKIAGNIPLPAPSASWPTITTLNTGSATTYCNSSTLTCLPGFYRPAQQNTATVTGENENAKITYSPNPTANAVVIQASAISCAKTNLVLYTMQGKILFSKMINTSGLSSFTETISLAGFASGAYVITVKGENFSKKEIVIKK